MSNQKKQGTSVFEQLYSPENALAALSMPESWVRSAMLIRSNSLIRGHSGVRLCLTEALLELLSKNCVPLVPLRGSISASGDLHPLAYIAGLLEGNPDVQVWTGPGNGRKLVPANEVLTEEAVNKQTFGPKEGLGITNGTAVSAGVASLALHDANNLAILSQFLTAMGTEALLGTDGSFHPFIATTRPHEGQTEVARNIYAFLRGSKLTRGEGKPDNDGLKQDRYALRTSSQWLSPVIEDLLLAHKQLTTELNSTTDNPLIDLTSQEIHHGGNFQAATVTSSTEKTRLSLQMIGKMIFAQSSELIDVHLNNGLPPNLAADEPSLSYTFKGVDVNMASYMSELAFVASPMSTHVQTAEMGNQALNSLALISARYTHTAVDLVALMSSAYLYSLCQALDLRAMHSIFLTELKPNITNVLQSQLPSGSTTDTSSSETAKFRNDVWNVLLKALHDNRNQDSATRCRTVARATAATLLEAAETPDVAFPVGNISRTVNYLAQSVDMALRKTRKLYMNSPDATPYLGTAAKRMYTFIRKDLDIPFHKGLCEHPATNNTSDDDGVGVGVGVGGDVGEMQERKTIGSRISVIYDALRSGRLLVPVMECVEEVLRVG